MKRLLRPIKANTRTPSQNKCMFTPADIEDFLLQIDELRSYDISLKENPDGSADFLIGNSVYHIADIAPAV